MELWQRRDANLTRVVFTGEKKGIASAIHLFALFLCRFLRFCAILPLLMEMAQKRKERNEMDLSATRKNVTYHDGAVVGMRPRHGHVQVEAVLALRRVRVPHFGPGESREHRVDDLNTRVGLGRGVEHAAPALGGHGRPEAAIAYGRFGEGHAPPNVNALAAGSEGPQAPYGALYGVGDDKVVFGILVAAAGAGGREQGGQHGRQLHFSFLPLLPQRNFLFVVVIFEFSSFSENGKIRLLVIARTSFRKFFFSLETFSVNMKMEKALKVVVVLLKRQERTNDIYYTTDFACATSIHQMAKKKFHFCKVIQKCTEVPA